MKTLLINDSCDFIYGTVKYWKYQYISIYFLILIIDIDINEFSIKRYIIDICRIKSYFPIPKYWFTDHCPGLRLDTSFYVETIKIQHPCLLFLATVGIFQELPLRLCKRVMFKILGCYWTKPEMTRRKMMACLDIISTFFTSFLLLFLYASLF